MKILMVLDREFPSDLRVENEMEALSEAGHEIHLACFTRKNRPVTEKTEFCQIHRKAISKLTYKSSVGALTIPMYFNFWRPFLGELCKGHFFDAIHVHDLPLVKPGLEIAARFNIPLTADLHENWPAYLRIATHTKSLAGKLLSPNKKWVNYEKTTLKLANNIIVVVDEAKERLVDLGIDPGRIHIVSNTLNMDHFKIAAREKKHDNIILFYAGGLNYHRGLQIVIEAIARIKDEHPEVHCWILGEGSYRKMLESLATKLEVEKQVVFHGWQTYEKMTEMMMDADFTLIPHLRSDHTDSTIPHKLFQYMYAKKPVIATDCKPIERIVNESGCGFIYGAEDVESLSKILSNLKEAVQLSMGEKGNKSVVDKYNFQADAVVLNGIYS